MQTYKNRFVGVFSGLHDSSPMQIWCRLLRQAKMKLNLQQKSAITPKISTYANVHGPYNFMHKPISPLGCPVLAHENPYKRGSWADHAINAWNLSTSMEQHRYLNVYIKHTRYERIFDMLFFKHKYLTSPIVTPEDTVVESTKGLKYTVTAKSKSTDSKYMESVKNWQTFLRKLQRKNTRSGRQAAEKQYYQNLQQRATTKCDCTTNKGGNHHVRTRNIATFDCQIYDRSSCRIIEAPHPQLNFPRWRRNTIQKYAAKKAYSMHHHPRSNHFGHRKYI